MSQYKITSEQIYSATDGGKAVILHYYPQSAMGFERRRNFRLRGDDRRPSGTVFQKDGVWYLQDKGGGDTKAYTAVSLVMREERLKFPQALEWIAAKFAPDLLEGSQAQLPGEARPRIEAAEPQDAITVQKRPGGKFTQEELGLLGHRITQEVCDRFRLVPLDSYTTRRNEKGKSWRICSTPSYPIYYYDYGTFGKIYQPLGELRFLWVGEKPQDLILGDGDFGKMYDKALKSGADNPFLIPADPDDEESEEQDLTWKELIICSGPSDALNVNRAGWHVCWLNSETAELTAVQYNALKKMAKKIYLLYDIDDTGRERMHKIALDFLDISIISLPDDLPTFRTRKGKPCKDAKDFFVHYRKPALGDVDQIFSDMVKLSVGLKFWTESLDKRNSVVYDVNNIQMYAFLQAMGYYTIADPGRGFTFCHVQDNRVELIPADEIKPRCMAALRAYLEQHPYYFRQALINRMFRSQQISKDSFSNLRRITPNFDAFTPEADFFFFRNCIVKVTARGIETVKASECPYMVYRDKIIDHDFHVEEPFFDVRKSPEYARLSAELARLTPRTPEYIAKRKEIDALKDTGRWQLDILRPDFDWLKFVYNTGRVYWQEEERGYTLTPEQVAEQDLNFVAKVAALGYMMSKHKDAARPYGVYAMETEMGDVGEHRGGTGKSILLNSVEKLRRQVYIDGRAVKSDKMDFILQQVKAGYTDTIYIDDLNAKVDLHYFMNWITGKMEVNAKYADKVTLDYASAPKVSFSSNHAISNFDGSLKRRTWFAAFSNYYHSEDEAGGLTHRSPDMEFRRTLIQDYGPEDMNRFYNFMLDCIVVWKKYRERIQPSMKAIERRNLKTAMTQEFLNWAEDWFTDERLNRLLETSAVFDEYRKTLPKVIAENMKPTSFKRRLKLFCQYKDWVFNPEALMTTASERERCDIRRKVMGQDRYYFYIDTSGGDGLQPGVIFDAFDRAQGCGETGAAPAEDAEKPLF